MSIINGAALRSAANGARRMDSGWKALYQTGGVAALVAALIFRRNIAAEVSLISGQQSPRDVSAWFDMLQHNAIFALTMLSAFDILNYALVGLMFLALFAALNQVNKSHMAIATALGLAGAAV